VHNCAKAQGVLILHHHNQSTPYTGAIFLSAIPGCQNDLTMMASSVKSNFPSVMASQEAESNRPIQKSHSDCAQGEGNYTSSATMSSRNGQFLEQNIISSVYVLTSPPQASAAVLPCQSELHDDVSPISNAQSERSSAAPAKTPLRLEVYNDNTDNATASFCNTQRENLSSLNAMCSTAGASKTLNWTCYINDRKLLEVGAIPKKTEKVQSKRLPALSHAITPTQKDFQFSQEDPIIARALRIIAEGRDRIKGKTSLPQVPILQYQILQTTASNNDHRGSHECTLHSRASLEHPEHYPRYLFAFYVHHRSSCYGPSSIKLKRAMCEHTATLPAVPAPVCTAKSPPTVLTWRGANWPFSIFKCTAIRSSVVVAATAAPPATTSTATSTARTAMSIPA
jgi:hypothetical protein